MNKYIEHLKTINKHKLIVFKLCLKSGIPFRGLVHDLSKYSFTEFFESVKYYTGRYSPIVECKKDKGYSFAWLHHKAKNKHHYEYWYDASSPKIAIIPYKYAVEMICDRVAAGMTYKGGEFKEEYPYKYFLLEMKKYKYMINEKIYKFMKKVFLDLKNNGRSYIFRKKYFLETYNNIVEGDICDRGI